ncbi:MAG TPA: PHP domain-containing protein [Dermatophilaceae bacterium]|nr:PHP domain-containing protein [Dermatophilaceae bacterium]
MPADLHVHSTASDGTDSPSAVVELAAAAGLTTVGLTDHDTTGGWHESATAAERVGIGLVRGVEVSAQRAGASVHVLGYLPDPAHAELAGELERARASRVTRLDRMVERMAADGIPVTVASVRAQLAPGATPGRPHIADALVAAGVVPDRDAAFATYLSARSRYYVSHYAPDPVRAVQLVRAAGGVAVVAHPFATYRGRTTSDALLAEMAAAGLDGIEVHHRDHDGVAVAHGLGLARDLGLLVTGSSDYHGTGKVNRLGEHTTTPEVLEEIVARASGVPVVAA